MGRCSQSRAASWLRSGPDGLQSGPATDGWTVRTGAVLCALFLFVSCPSLPVSLDATSCAPFPPVLGAGVTPAAMARESVRLGREVLARGGGGGGAEEAASAEAGASSTQLPPLLYMEHAGGHEIPSKALADLSSFLQGVLAGGSGGRAAASAAGGGPDSCPP